MKKYLLFLIVMLFITACATVPPIQTQSGMPEVTICGVNKAELMEKSAASFSMSGATIRSSNNYQIVIGQPVRDIVTAALFGSRYDSTPEERVIFTFADVGDNCTYVGIRVQIVTNPGSGFERITDISRGKDAFTLQQQLVQMKYRIESSRGISSEPVQNFNQKKNDDDFFKD